MKTKRSIWALLLGLWATSAAMAQAPASAPSSMPEHGDTAAVDYRDPSAWICRPGIDDGTCSAGLAASTLDGRATRDDLPRAHAVAAPRIDCFYVYPTASLAPTMFSDMAADQAVKRVVNAQAARLGSQCRLFVPIYHQVTIAALRWRMANVPAGRETDSDIDIPYRDVLAAWHDYLRYDNRGRGVVLVSHSQGSRILKRLIADEVDGKPVQHRLVAAYLAGNSNLDAASFQHVAACRAPDQTGCVVAWSSYIDGYDGPRVFGDSPTGTAPLCVNPAALAGGRAMANAFLPKAPSAAAGDPPFVAVSAGLSAECVADGNGAVVRIRVDAGHQAGRLAAALRPSRAGPSWGLHPLDIALFQGNIIELIARQSAAWGRGR